MPPVLHPSAGPPAPPGAAGRAQCHNFPMEPSQAISGGPGTALSPGETGTRRSGIPAPVTALIGRRRECAGVAAALDSSRLVTLMGPGGVGKTRLALAVAAHLQPRFSGRPGGWNWPRSPGTT